MAIDESVLIKTLKRYFSENGFGEVDVQLGGRKGRVRTGHITVGKREDPLQMIGVRIREPRFLGKTAVFFDGDYLRQELADLVDDDGNYRLRESIHPGFLGYRDNNLRKVKRNAPSLGRLGLSYGLFGALNGMMATSVNAMLFMNLQGIGLLSLITDLAIANQGDILGETYGQRIINNRLQSGTPSSKIAQQLDANCIFMDAKQWNVRASLEDHLRQKYFCEKQSFEDAYLSKYDAIAAVLREKMEASFQARELIRIIFGDKAPAEIKDPLLYQHLKNMAQIELESAESSLRRFFGIISGLAKDVPFSERVWTRGQYDDLVREFSRVLKHGFYYEMDDEVRLLQESRKTLFAIQSGKKVRKEYLPQMRDFIENYTSFISTSRRMIDPVNTSGQNQLQKKIEQLRSSLAGAEVSLSAELIPELLRYASSRLESISKSGYTKVYCTLAEARRRFIDEPVMDYTRELTRKEMESMTDECFKWVRRASVGEIASVSAVTGMIITSYFYNTFPGGRLVNAVLWGSLIAANSLFESFCNSVSSRLTEYFQLFKYQRSLKRLGIDTDAGYSAISSFTSRASSAGYAAATFIGVPLLYLTTETEKRPIQLAMTAAAILLPLAYKSLLNYMKEAKAENNIH